ncbi:MAG: outer membrane lipoprotein carrier protein [Psychromonas sp.]|jgi:outer membrane lipoprotein carrier protein|uniref:outer membrane lipoprotein chaperone LolA n=1 Tax=Psychromonas sp. TaxID=1884585 RepID=UPI0039E3B993
MKKCITLLFVFIITPFYAHAMATTDAGLLKEKLAKFSQINAEFSQVVTSPEGNLLNESWGKLTISRPGKFRWQVITPEEELIVSDGKTMWLYSPFIEQVTLVNLSDAIEGTPFVLLSGATEKQWDNYTVKMKDNKFTIKNADHQLHDNTFIFEFNDADNISKFTVIEEQGQQSEFKLSHKSLTAPLKADFFDFQIPVGVDIDDQR